jgi:hypothetical protein
VLVTAAKIALAGSSRLRSTLRQRQSFSRTLLAQQPTAAVTNAISELTVQAEWRH